MTDGTGLLRQRQHGEHADGKVRFVELFFDLVFVFAVAQLSHLLLEHLSLQGALETGLLLLAVWWVWIDTTWVTNWLDPDKRPVRLMLFSIMLVGLVMSSSIPQAFGARALPFALCYVAIQVGRCLFMLWALKSHDPGNYLNFQRITVWLAGAGVFWIAGALAPPQWRLMLWGLGMMIEFVGPSVGFRVPGLGRSTTSDWNVSGEHMAERCGLFIIIALGESVLLTGATWAGLDWTVTNAVAMAASVVASIAMWWVYFHIGAERARGLIEEASDPGRLARLAYTYVHILLVAGIIVVAVGVELILKHPDGHIDVKTATVLLAGPALFLVGNLVFKWVTAGRPPLSHMGGLALLALLAPISVLLSPLTLSASTTGVLVLVAIWEARSFGRSTAVGH